MKIMRYFAVKLIIVILYLLTTCHSYPSSVFNNENKTINKRIEEEVKSIIFNNANNTLHRNIKINLTRIDRSVDAEVETMDIPPLTDDELNLNKEIFVKDPSTETSHQNKSCCIQKVNYYFDATVNIMRQWLNSLTNDCNRMNEILDFESTNKSEIEHIKDSCLELKGNYLKLFKSVMSALNKLQVENDFTVNNTCPIMAGLENIKNDIIVFTQRPDKIILANNLFSNLLTKFPSILSSDHKILQNNSNLIMLDKNSNIASLTKIIGNLRNVPQKIRGSIEELINNLRKPLSLERYQELKELINSNSSDLVDNSFNSSTHEKIPFINPLEKVLNIPTLVKSSLNNPISQAFDNLRNLLQQIKEIIDKQISDIRNAFTTKNCKELEAMTNTNFSDVNNSSDSNIHQKLPLQKHSSSLLKNLFNSPISGKSTCNNPFSKTFENFRNLPEKMRKSIDEVISNIKNILVPGKCQELNNMINGNISNPVDNTSDLSIYEKTSFLNPFENILKFPTLIKSSLNNPISRAFDNLRNLPDRMKKSIDEVINNIKNLLIPGRCQELKAMTINNISEPLDSSVHEINPLPKSVSGLFNKLFYPPAIAKPSFNNLFLQMLGNLNKLPQEMKKLFDEMISNIRAKFRKNDYKGPTTMTNSNITNTVNNLSDSSNHKKLPFQNPLNGLFKNLFDSPKASKSLFKNSPLMTNLFSPPKLLSQALDNLRSLPREMKKLIDELILNMRNLLMKNDFKEPTGRTNTNGNMSDTVDNLPGSLTHEKLPFQKSSNRILKNLFSSPTLEKSSFGNPFSQALNNFRNFPQKMRKSIDDVISNFRHFLISDKFQKIKTEIRSETTDEVDNPLDTSDHEAVPSNPTSCKHPPDNFPLKTLDNLRNLPREMETLIDEQVSNIKDVFMKKDCEKRKIDVTDATNDSPNSSIPEKFVFQKPLSEFFNNLFDSSTTSKSSSKNPFLRLFGNLRNLPQKMENSINEQIANLKNMLLKHGHKELKTVVDSDDSDDNPNNNLTNFLNMLFKDIKKTSPPAKLLSHDSLLFEKIIKELPTNVIKSLMPKDSKEPPAKTKGFLSKIDPSIIYKVFSPSQILKGLFSNIFKSSSHIKSSSHDYFLDVVKNLHYLSQNVKESINEQISNFRHVVMSNHSKGRKTADKKQPKTAKIVVKIPYYQLFKKQSNTLPSIKSPLPHSWAQLFNKPLLKTYSSPFYKSKIVPRAQSDCYKHYSMRKFF